MTAGSIKLLLWIAAFLSAKAAEIDLDEVLKAEEVWVLRFTDSSAVCSTCADFEDSWDMLTSSLKRVHTASVDLSEAEGQKMAEMLKLDITSLPLLQAFTKGSESRTIVKGDEASKADLKTLRRFMKKTLKGLSKNSNGRFMKTPDASDSSRFSSTDLMFMVQSQPAAEHEVRLAEELRSELTSGGVRSSRIQLLHRIFNKWERDQSGPPYHVDYWCYVPWLLQLGDSKSKWYFFLEPDTKVRLGPLKTALAKLDYKEKHYIGMGLKDEEASVARGYDVATLYPLRKAGFGISHGLLEALLQSLKADALPVEQNIDALHQMAQLLERRLGVRLNSLPAVFCAASASETSAAPGTESCGTVIADREAYRQAVIDEMKAKGAGAGEEEEEEPADGMTAFEAGQGQGGLQYSDVIIGVKTTANMKDDTGASDYGRLEVIRRTWAKQSPIEIVYLSDAADEVYETIDLTDEWGEVVNQKKGHCAKTDAILKYFGKYQKGKKFYVISDDDGLFNVEQLFKVLASYNHLDPTKEKLYIGERYGYAHNGQGRGPYDYITMGGGMAMSQAALLARNACEQDGDCVCKTPDMFDDMQMGLWMNRLHITAVHEEGFHQARPLEYHPTTLKFNVPVSFHKFKNKDTGKGINVPETTKWYDEYLMMNSAKANCKDEL